MTHQKRVEPTRPTPRKEGQSKQAPRTIILRTKPKGKKLVVRTPEFTAWLVLEDGDAWVEVVSPQFDEPLNLNLDLSEQLYHIVVSSIYTLKEEQDKPIL